MRFRVLLSLSVALIACVSCATPVSYAPGTPQEARQLKVGVGDEIRVVTTYRERVTLRIVEVREDRFVGKTTRLHRKDTRPKGVVLEVPYDDIALIEVTRADAASAAAVTGFVLLNVGLGLVTPVTVLPGTR